MNLSLRHLQLVKAIGDAQNFARAAQKLNISQPALSRAVTALEEQLGCKLFDRSRKGVTPTVFGKFLLKRGGPILQDVSIVERDLNQLQGLESGEMIIGSGPLPAEVSLGKAVARFSRNYPKINVQIIVDRTPNLLTMLHSRELDLFVADTRMITDNAGLNITILPKQQGYFYCRRGHPLTEKKHITVEDVFSYPLATMWFPKVLLNALARSVGLQLGSMKDLPCTVLQCDYLKVLSDIVAESDAIGLITRPVLNSSIHKQQFILLPISTSELNTHYGLISLTRYSQSPVVQIFQEYIIETDEQCNREIEKNNSL